MSSITTALVLRDDAGVAHTFFVDSTSALPGGLVPGMRVNVTYEALEGGRAHLISVGTSYAMNVSEVEGEPQEPPAVTPRPSAEPKRASTMPAALSTFGLSEAASGPSTEAVKRGPVQRAPVKSEPVRSVPVRSVPVKSEPVKSEPGLSGTASTLPNMLVTATLSLGAAIAIWYARRTCSLPRPGHRGARRLGVVESLRPSKARVGLAASNGNSTVPVGPRPRHCAARVFKASSTRAIRSVDRSAGGVRPDSRQAQRSLTHDCRRCVLQEPARVGEGFRQPELREGGAEAGISVGSARTVGVGHDRARAHAGVDASPEPLGEAERSLDHEVDQVVGRRVPVAGNAHSTSLPSERTT